MRLKLPIYLFFLLATPVFLTSCIKVYEEIADPEKEVFNFIVTDLQRLRINISRGQEFEIDDPLPVLRFAGKTYSINRFSIRGESTLDFYRKGFSLNMDREITLHNQEEPAGRKIEEFKLLAMVYDYTYIENCTAVGLLREVGLWPVYSFFTEVRLNDRTQGLYHFVEDPVEYFAEQKNSSFVLRRGYDHSIKSYFSGPESKQGQQYYLSRFKKIYSDINNYSGIRLFDTLSACMDLEQYFTKLSVDMLLKNGDATDEVFFYTKIRDGREIFGVFPWDYDDIFASKPHEIGRSWAIGTVFGHREYSGTNDIIAAVGSKLIFSIEDDLDFKIATDSVLYQEYLKTLRSVAEKIDYTTIDKIFKYTFEHISPFYSSESIIVQSKFDVNETNYDLFVTNLASKRQLIKERRNFIIQELDKQQNYQE